jgi:hypothetical protein
MDRGVLAELARGYAAIDRKLPLWIALFVLAAGLLMAVFGRLTHDEISHDEVSFENCCKITKGMTKKDVRMILGRDCDDAQPIIVPPFLEAPKHDDVRAIQEVWHGARGRIEVLFAAPLRAPVGAEYKVFRSATFVPVVRNERNDSVIRKLMRWLSWQ